jgi:predicted SAM-dependent methyltransferase
MTSIAHTVMRKLAHALASRSTTRATLVDILLERHFSDVLTAIVQSHGKETLNALLESRSSEALQTLAHNHVSQMIDAMCRDHLQQVIAQVYNTSGGHFKYVGSGKLKVIIGAGSQRHPGWLATDINVLNITHDSSWRNLFNMNEIDNILAEHVVEHLSLDELYRVLECVRTYLKPGGIFRVAVPDAFHPSRYYYNLVKPGGLETPNQHKLFFDYEMFTRIAEGSGYKIRLLEYFDESGVFHKEIYSQDDGFIQRCAENNRGIDISDEEVMGRFYSTIPEHLRQQFYDRNMTYTSLIADLIK